MWPEAAEYCIKIIATDFFEEAELLFPMGFGIYFVGQQWKFKLQFIEKLSIGILRAIIEGIEEGLQGSGMGYVVDIIRRAQLHPFKTSNTSLLLRKIRCTT